MNENNNEVSVNESQVSTTPIEENVQNTKKKKFPFVIIFLILLVFAGYFFFSNKDMFLKGKEEKATPSESIKVDEKEENKEEEKDSSKPEQENKDSDKDNKEEQKEPSNNTSEPTNTNSPENSNDQTSSPVSDNPSQNSSDIVIQPSGIIMYLYEESYMEMDGVGFEHISSTSNSITVDVTIHDNTQRYTIPFGQETKINHLKNLVVVNDATDSYDLRC